jgi:tetratricopeptide (TPR) repeat protein
VVLGLKLITGVCALSLVTACQNTPDKAEEVTHVATTPEVTIPIKETPKKEPVTAIDTYVLYLLLTGETALQRQQYEIALEAYLEAAKRVNDPRIAEKAAQIGMYLNNVAKTEQAASLWLNKDDKNITAREIALSKALSDKNQAAFLKHLNAILKNDPAAFEAILLDVERALKGEAEVKFIYQTLDVLAKQHPQQAAIFLSQSILAVRQNNIELARQKIQQVLSLQPDWEKAVNFEAELLMYSGKLAFKKKQFAEALAWFDKVKKGSLATDAGMAAVSVLFEQKDFAQAAQRLDALLTKEQDSKRRTQLLVMQAELYSEQKNYPKAIEVLTHALKDAPEQRDILYARALIAEKMGDIASLEADLQKILAKDPNDAGALNALGYTLTDHSTRYDEAEKYLQKALKLQPDEAVIIDSYGWLQFKKGNLASALKYLESAHKKLPENEITAHLAEVLWASGRKKEAEVLVNQALQKTPTDEILLEFQQRVIKGQ